MDTDLILVLGIIIAALSIPPIFGAMAERRAPRAAAVLLLIGGGMIIYALQQNPTGYTISDIPDVFVRVIGSFLN